MPPSRQRPGAPSPLAGFQVSIIGRFWVSTEGLQRIDRRTGAAQALRSDGQLAAGLTIRPDTFDAYAVSNVTWDVWRIPPPYAGNRFLITNVRTLLAGGELNHMTFVPTPNQGELVLGAVGRALRLPLGTGMATILATWLSPFGRRNLECDRRHADFWMLEDGGPVNPDIALTMNRTGSVSQIVPFGLIGNPTGLAINDFPTGTLNCAPMNVPQSGVFTLEIGLWGNPGEIAVLAITRPVPILLGMGTFDRGGNYHLSLTVPAGAIRQGTPGTLEFMGASIHPQTLQATISAGKRWPKN